MTEYNELLPSKMRQELLKKHSQDGEVKINEDLILALKDGEFFLNEHGKTIEYCTLDQLKSIYDYLQSTKEKPDASIIPGVAEKSDKKTDASIIPDDDDSSPSKRSDPRDASIIPD